MAADPTRTCEVCGADVAKLKGARRCAACLQVQRREWKADLLAIWENGLRLRWSLWKIAYAASVRLGRPLWGRSGGIPGSGSEGVIPAGVALGIFPRSMLQQAAAARRGEEGEL